MVRRISVALVLLLLAGWVAWAPTARWIRAEATERVALRVGHPVTIGALRWKPPLGAELRDLAIGPVEAPLVRARSVHVQLDSRSLRRGELRPAVLVVVDPELEVEGDGTLPGVGRALRARLRALRPPSSEAPAPAHASESPVRKRPGLRVDGLRITDRAGALELDGGALTMAPDGAVRGRLLIAEPDLGVCTLEGAVDAPAVRCERPVRHTIRGSTEHAEVLVSQGRWSTADGAILEDLRIRPKLAPKDPILAAAIDLVGRTTFRVALSPAEHGRFDVSARAALPGAGRIALHGRAGGDAARLRAELVAVELGAFSQNIQGQATGHLDLEIDRAPPPAPAVVRPAGTRPAPGPRLGATGELALAGLTVTHPALSPAPIGPTDLTLTGRAAADGAGVTVEAARLTVGDVTLQARGRHAPGRWSAHLEIPITDGAALGAAIPPGLLAHLEPVELTGSTRASVHLAIDVERPDDTVLEVELALDDLLVRSWSEDVDFNRLRRRFRTRFEEADGTVHTRLTGPKSRRWVPLEAVAPILPIAITVQEDGRFWNHGGVNAKHIRGALVDNLKAGRFVRGGSTLTMQLARNLFLGRKKHLSRKLEEVILAWQLERHFEKEALMALYLNVVEFGPGVFGVGEASQHYFQKPPADLSPVEAVYLTRLLPAPRRGGPHLKRRAVGDGFARYMDVLLDLLLKRGYLNPDERAAAEPRALWSPEGGLDGRPGAGPGGLGGLRGARAAPPAPP